MVTSEFELSKNSTFVIREKFKGGIGKTEKTDTWRIWWNRVTESEFGNNGYKRGKKAIK